MPAKPADSVSSNSQNSAAQAATADAGASALMLTHTQVSMGTPAAQRGISYLYMMAAFVIVTAGLRMAQEILQLLLLSIFIAVVGVPVYAWLVQKKIASWLALGIVICGLIVTTLVVFWIVMTSLADFTSRQQDYADKLRERTRPLQQIIERLIPETPAETPEKDTKEPDESAGVPQVTKPAESTTVPVTDVPAVVSADVPSDVSAESESDSDSAQAANMKQETTTANIAERIDESFTAEATDGAGWLQPRKIVEPPRSRRSWRALIMSQFDPGRMISMAATLALSVSQILSNTMLILLTVVFILLEASTFPQKLQTAFGQKPDTQQRYQQIVNSVRSYLVIKTAISLMTGVLIAIWLWLFGVPYAGLWGMIAFLLNYIPNVGSIIAAVPALMVAWLDLGLLPCMACAIGYVVVNLVIGNIIEPRVMGRGMGLSALVVFCSMVFWGWALGPVGMLLSVPLTMAVRVALEGFEDTRWLGTLLGNTE